MEKISYDEIDDVLYISLSEEHYVESVNTKALILYMDSKGNICRIGIKNARNKGLLDELNRKLYIINNIP
ncbi:MAG: DUF2283 domain-containing protein [Candidatus Nitrosocaldaceae archaeon]